MTTPDNTEFVRLALASVPRHPRKEIQRRLRVSRQQVQRLCARWCEGRTLLTDEDLQVLLNRPGPGRPPGPQPKRRRYGNGLVVELPLTPTSLAL